ncbi:hypothetical protein [Pseudomonas matsuisoli]|uniref:Uncharacterized protein n=1 Tax=Pseudomonas matsuisoli TaxID=1515666 RepID=A0A917PWY8_9PSED|nr:hypothetical protein [Pseudomonas matsuisoli]GGJ96057.1 hypothetical protein GCM10009304_22480 [Pseudomonas matsuisoli]
MMPIEFFAMALLGSGVLLILAYLAGVMLLKQMDPNEFDQPTHTVKPTVVAEDFTSPTLRT